MDGDRRGSRASPGLSASRAPGRLGPSGSGNHRWHSLISSDRDARLSPAWRTSHRGSEWRDSPDGRRPRGRGVSAIDGEEKWSILSIIDSSSRRPNARSARIGPVPDRRGPTRARWPVTGSRRAQRGRSARHEAAIVSAALESGAIPVGRPDLRSLDRPTDAPERHVRSAASRRSDSVNYNEPGDRAAGRMPNRAEFRVDRTRDERCPRETWA